MVLKAIEMALDDRYGYSQKPPSGRWGPDYDCSSFIYEIADYAGYPVGRGPDKVRFTGVMLKDFLDAGFQVLPFANVGISGLKLGDILLNLAVHAEIYVGDGVAAAAEHAENGDYIGKAGDQTGEEISLHPIADIPVQWNFILRPPEEDEEDEEEEGDDMPNYPMATQGNMGGWQGRIPNTMNGYPQAGYQQYTNQTYPQGMYGNQTYPQGNLGQMNGYSQANAGGWPQAGQNQQGYQQGAKFVSGIQEANEKFVPAGVTECFLTNDWKHLIIKSADQQGYPSMRVFDIKECMEEGMGQQEMGGYPQGMEQPVSRQEFEQLKEMLQNVQSDGHAQGTDGSKSNRSNARNS